MGLPSNLWHAIDIVASTSDDEADFAIEDLLNLVQQTTLLVEQSNKSISHHIHLNPMVGVIKSFSPAKA